MSFKTSLTDDSSEATAFIDRRSYVAETGAPIRERRQFSNSYSELTPEARDLATAIDEYKLVHRRRFITYEEMLTVVKALGYVRNSGSVS